jgi:DNA-binding response OmpR family regulator
MPRLLLIEDDAMVREVLATVLVHAGHTVVEARDGREGMVLFHAESPDLVITDLIMPDHEGMEVIATLHRAHPELPIIAMSGCGSRSSLYLRTAEKLGASRTLPKPFAPAELLGAVEELLRSRPETPDPR